MPPALAAKAANDIVATEITRGDVANLWVYLGVGVAFIVVLVALIMWYRHRTREEGNVQA